MINLYTPTNQPENISMEPALDTTQELQKQ